MGFCGVIPLSKQLKQRGPRCTHGPDFEVPMLDSLGDPSRRLQGVRNGGKSDNKNHGFTALKTNPTWRIIPGIVSG